MDLQTGDTPRTSRSPAAWLKHEIELRLSVGWLAAGGALFLALLIIALD